MKRSWAVRLGSLALVALAATLTFAPVYVYAKPDNNEQKQDRKGNNKDNPSWSDPLVHGIVTNVFWAEAREKGQHTATIVIFSPESDIPVTIYGDDPTVRQAVVDGTVCTGRYAEVGGDRLDADNMIGRAVKFSDTATECVATIGPEPS